MANQRTGSNVQELGVCHPILSVHTIRTLPCWTNWHGNIVQTIFRTQEIHRTCKTKRNLSARKTKMCNSATKLSVKECSNGQWQRDFNTMEVYDGGKCNPTYLDWRTNGRGVAALFSGFKKWCLNNAIQHIYEFSSNIIFYVHRNSESKNQQRNSIPEISLCT